MKKLIILIYGILITSMAFGQVRFEAKLDSSHILIGDQTTLHLKVTQNPDWKIVFPSSIELGDSVEVLDARQYQLESMLITSLAHALELL